MFHKKAIQSYIYFLVARYFVAWSSLSFKRWKPRVIIITGSVGKTTMLGLVESQMGKKAHYSHYANSSFGIAFDIVGLKGVTKSRWRWLWLALIVPWRSLFFTRSEEFYVVELDGGRPKGASLITKVLKPEVSLWISVGNSHAEYYDWQVETGQFTTVEEAIAHEFATVPKLTSKLAIIDGSNQVMTDLTQDISAERAPVTSTPAAYELFPDKTIIDTGLGYTFELPNPAAREITTQLQMLVLLLNYLDMPIKSDLADFYTPPGRSNYIKGVNGLSIIDSTYNAHLLSMKSLLEMFAEMKAPGEKIVLLADMAEQGDSAPKLHRELGEIVLSTGIKQVILIGALTRTHTLPVLESDPSVSVTSLDTNMQALDHLKSTLKGNETLLLKGSAGRNLEWIISKLLLNEEDRVLLPRMDEASILRRAKKGMR